MKSAKKEFKEFKFPKREFNKMFIEYFTSQQNNNTMRIEIIKDRQYERNFPTICYGVDRTNLGSVYNEHKYVFVLKNENDETGAIAIFSIPSNYLYLDALCTNKISENPEYTHDGAATLLLNLLKKFVDKVNKKHNFIIDLTSVKSAEDYYLRQHFNPISVGAGGFTYGLTSEDNLREDKLWLRQQKGEPWYISERKMRSRIRALKNLREDGTKETSTKEPIITRKSRRLHAKKKYDYKIILYIG